MGKERVVTDVTDVFDEIVAGFDSPMFVVTAFDGHELDGCLVGFATQCSIDPVRFLVCLSVKNRTYRIAQDATTLGVHVLRADHRSLAELFGGETGDEVDKFASIAWHAGPEAVPIIDGCDWFAGPVLARYDLGDHQGVLLDVAHASREGRGGAIFGFQSARDIDAGHHA